MESRPPLADLAPSQQNTQPEDVDFSKLTPSLFGISTESFVPSSINKDKSRLAQLKARRRSSIGVRGSPETNSLICFRAKHLAKTPPGTSQLLQGSPFLSRCDSLKKKMAAFQCLMEEDKEINEEKKNEDQDEKSSFKASQDEKENKPLPPPSKKRCYTPTSLSEDKISEMAPPDSFVTTLPGHGVNCTESESEMPPSEVSSDAKIELLSLPMLSKPDRKPEEENMASVRKKKRVRFGAALSPEFFDKTLPPSTPLQKGGTPSCPPSSTGPKRSLLKTPQQQEDPFPQPNFNILQSYGASPELHTSRSRTDFLYSDEVFEAYEKISFPSLEVETPSENAEEESTQPQDRDTEVMNSAFQEEEDVPSNSEPGETQPSTTSDQSLCIDDAGPEKIPSSDSVSEQPRSRSKKRKQPEESKPERRKSSRSAAASASGKMKETFGGKRFGNKKVDRSLYGKRDYASKNPLLSPIFETSSSSLIVTPAQSQNRDIADAEQTSTNTEAIPPMVSLGTSCAWTNENDQTLRAVVTDICSDMNENSLECSSLVGRGSSSKAKRHSGRFNVKRRRNSGTVRKKCDYPAIDVSLESDAGAVEQETEIPKPADGEFHPLNQESPVLETHALGSCSVADEEPTTAESLEEVMSTNGGHELDQKVLKSPVVNINMVEENTEHSERSLEHDARFLAPWQQDFNIEDILKPVVKSRKTVRRSMRNRKSMDQQGAGMAWVDHTSPELVKPARRKTCGRLSGAFEAFRTQALEETTLSLGE
ncbi:hypothetical protein DNTS_018843 [Danionella cerebrum]|uniref:PP1-binding domain-containing protein n=1 Tax=Danionella cerebrum TaxID=2873325 RepID=A0A553QMK8_9TELE|nr:hypothetical protein DNTS_018843 [Danionella translucida]